MSVSPYSGKSYGSAKSSSSSTPAKTTSPSYSQAVANINAVKSTSASEKATAISGLSKYYPSGGSGGDALTSSEWDNQIKSVGEEMVKVGKKSPYDTNAPTAQGTTQPSQLQTGSMPSTPVQNQGAVPYDQALKAIQTSGQSTGDIARATQSLKERYNQGFNASQGTEAPKSAGEAMGMVNKLAPVPETESGQFSPLTSIVETDTTFDKIFTEFDDFYSPVKQRQSMLEEYKSMESALGISSLNAELINTKRIIEGTEDDIRSEVQAVSGFATDSQVMALANARNKSLVKNYNYLLESRDSAMTQLSTMMNLSMKDREIAQQEFDTKMNYAFKVKEFTRQAARDTLEQNNSTLKLMGADGVYNSLIKTGDPTVIAKYERSMGMPVGSLQIAAQQATKDRANQATMDSLDLEGKRLSNANIRSQIAERSVGTTGGKIVKVNGVDYIQNADGSLSNPQIPTSTSSAQNLAYDKSSIDELEALKTASKGSAAIGPTGLFGRFKALGIGAGKRQELIAGVEQLRSQLSLDNLINAKARGATFGALSEGEMRVLSASATKLGTWADTDKDGNVTKYKTTEANFKKELDKISNFAKLDYVLKGGVPTDVGVQIMPDDTYWTTNSDGSFTQIR